MMTPLIGGDLSQPTHPIGPNMGVTQTEFLLVKGDLPPRLNLTSLSECIDAFILESDVPHDNLFELCEETIGMITQALYSDPLKDFWVIINRDGGCGGYLIGNWSESIIGTKTYYVLQAYAADEHKGSIFRKLIWETVRQYAKDNGAKHMIAVGARNPKAQARLLGKNYYEYVTFLKEDFN